ncbi:Uncharacterised protein [Mycobacteroides abscessus subsp. abscessus]|uniref:hypothetical protein n=1 Tax=Mycobacteroides abscessus TaxID=36809 RepID=UPI00092C8FD0|nr:hypothetical protein [Mycobacteroides abscessus]MBE5494641.1 hypothetical protein [Mycobacteroides abscessus]MBN7450296.1 hypothetical protein [Mycobacteroides abscessus subsp. abscessus]MDM2423026.1 hypothetical protein [Mycobacteroides abscessus]MDM2427307.1 hypothetical protein [Mycobacteroides abscessus]MDM2429382.1 hypothetical protein [Mycobacteroides abscessus]
MSPTELRPWPADPVSAWAQAVAAPAAKSRYGERPSIRPLEEIAADVRGQRVFVPAVALVFTVVGAILVGGLLVGVFPRSGHSTSAGVQWFAGVVLLIVGPALWLGHRQWRKYEERQGFPPARGVLCEIYPTSFHIGDGDGWCLTSVAIDARTPDEQVSRIATAFRIWLARLEADKEADSAAKNAWNSGFRRRIINAFASDEIFGPEASGGYLVRGTAKRSRWALLLDWREPEAPAYPMRNALVIPVDQAQG